MILKNGNNLSSNLEAYWKLNGNSNDSIGSRHGTDTGVTYIAGKINQCAQLLTGQKITFPTLSLPAQWTFNCWFMPLSEDAQTYKAIVATQAIGFGFYYQQSAGINNNKVIMYDGVSSYRFNNTSLITDTWNMITFVYNNGIGQWYLNGQIDSQTYNISNGYLDQIGGSHPAFESNENIDEIGIWNRALTSSDISDLYNNGLGLDLDNFKSVTSTVLMQNSAPLLKNLFSYYPMQGNSNDIVGTNNGTDTSISYVNGKIQQAAQYTSSSNINVGPMPELSGADKITVSFWIKSPDLLFPGFIIKNNCIEIRYDGTFLYGIGVYIWNNTFSNDALFRNSTGTLILNQWCHVAVIYDGTQTLNIDRVKIYINGVPTVTNVANPGTRPEAPSTLNSNINNLFIGNNLTGSMDEVGFWNRVLSPAEILSLYNGSNGLSYPFYDSIKISNPFLLDQLRDAKMAYSVRKLRSKYRGYCMRVRRSNDNVEMNIGFNYLGNLDTATLLNFVGSNSAYIVTWYDQTGNNFNMTQSDTTKQPIIVNAGTLYTQSNKPAIYYPTTNIFLEISLEILATTYTLFGRHTFINVPAQGVEFLGGDSNVYGVYIYPGNSGIAHGLNGTFFSGAGSATLNTPQTTSLFRTNLNVTAYINTTQTIMSQVGSAGDQLFKVSSLSGENAFAGMYNFTGYMQEAIIWETDKRSQILELNKNINTYYK